MAQNGIWNKIPNYRTDGTNRQNLYDNIMTDDMKMNILYIDMNIVWLFINKMCAVFLHICKISCAKSPVQVVGVEKGAEKSKLC